MLFFSKIRVTRTVLLDLRADIADTAFSLRAPGVGFSAVVLSQEMDEHGQAGQFERVCVIS